MVVYQHLLELVVRQYYQGLLEREIKKQRIKYLEIFSV